MLFCAISLGVKRAGMKYDYRPHETPETYTRETK